jgi:hypothetical protein
MFRAGRGMGSQLRPGVARLWNRPHVHSNRPIRFDCRFPNPGEEYFSIRANKIIVSLLHVWSKAFYMQESLTDEFFHALVYN